METTKLIQKINKLRFEKSEIEKRIKEVEESLFVILEAQRLAKDEGAVKLYGATVCYKMNRVVDQKILSEYSESWPESVKKCIKWKAELDLKAYRGVQEFDKSAFEIISKYITSKPAKPSIKLSTEE